MGDRPSTPPCRGAIPCLIRQTISSLLLAGWLLAGLALPGAAAGWEGSAAWEAEWEGPGPPVHRLAWEALGPVAVPGWRAETSLVLERLAAPESLRISEGGFGLAAPAFQLQLLLDQPHLPSRDPLGLISGGRRGEGQPAFTLEAFGRSWDLALQGVRQIDNPGPDGDLAALRLQGWWPRGRTALTLFRLETGMLGGAQPSDPALRGLLQELASAEGYLEMGSVEVGLQVVETRTAGWSQKPLGPPQDVGASLLRLRTLPWRPSEAFRLEGGLFQTDPGFRSLAAREQRLPADAAGFWTEARLRTGGWRWDGRLLHARLRAGGTEAEAALTGRLTWAGLTWTAGVEASQTQGSGGADREEQLHLGLARSGRWEVTWRGGSDTGRFVVWGRLGWAGLEGRAGLDAADGGIVRIELRRRESPWWRVIWKGRREREPDRYLFLEAGHELENGSFASVAVGRWDRGRYDALWGWPERLTVTVGRRF